MNFKYPNGKRYEPTERDKQHRIKSTKNKNHSYSNRGMTLEEDLNDTNAYYLDRNIAVIHKKPTPVQIVQVDYPRRSAAVIKEAYFKQASTTDYNGVFKGIYIDFEAKETKNQTSFPLANFHTHQIEHMKTVVQQNGIAFVILRFSSSEEIFLLPFPTLHYYWNRMVNGGRKSITKDEIVNNGFPIPVGLQPRLDYLKIVEKLTFKLNEPFID
ncbi:Holliday junction resolvase RecU [Bacillus spongiae]|uniref:Holliday junction resolvase RecU n=1 Tax=Bacillus spongiae TaxID=2683610 RepID=A0ABU8HDC1_9BACI